MSDRRTRAAFGIAAFAALAFAALYARTPAARALAAGFVGQAGALSTDHWLAFCAGQVAVAALGILPASLMAIAAGAAYGMGGGLAVSSACTMLGGWLAFMLSRSMLRPLVQRLIARRGLSARIDDAVASEGWKFVCFLRMSPVMPFAATSYGLGLTRIGQRAYLLGTLASLPALASYVALGALARHGVTLTEARSGPLYWALPALGVVALFVAVERVRRLVDRAGAPHGGAIAEA